MAGWMRVRDGSGLGFDEIVAISSQELSEAQVLRIRGARADGEPLKFWRAVGETLGSSADLMEDSFTGELQRAPGQWMDVRFEPDRADSYRHHNVGQPLHSDCAYIPEDRSGDIAVFFLERQARDGGDSLFVDAATVDAFVRDRDPKLHQLLTTLPIRFGKATGTGRTAKVLDRRDGRLKINWNYFRVLPGQGEAVDRLRADFHALLQQMVDEGASASFRLEKGEVVFFHDDEVLHGRRAYAAEHSGDRLLWKTYFRSFAAGAELRRAG
jgi:alpha-ketoglutarate-dependent taurine dioxygenase